MSAIIQTSIPNAVNAVNSNSFPEPEDTSTSVKLGDYAMKVNAPIIPATPTAIESILAERGTRYGSFEGHAAIAQELKGVMVTTAKWRELNHMQKEALEMVAHKIGRILNGDPNYKDSWTDIIGYIKLVEQTL